MIPESKNSYCVYCHTLKIDGRKYIGITKQKPEYRWRNGEGYHADGYHSRFYNAIKKYGWDNFEHEILFDGLTDEEAKAIEIQLIEKYQTTNKKYGFNTLRGGDLGGSGVKQSSETIDKRRKKIIGQKRSEETKRKISEWHKNPPKEYRDSLSKAFTGRTVDEAKRKKISEATKKAMQRPEVREKVLKANVKGRTPWNKGRQHSEETKQRIKESLKNVDYSKKKMNRKKVICLETQEIFPSLRCACDYIGAKFTGNLSECCKGKKETFYGYHWAYAEGDD